MIQTNYDKETDTFCIAVASGSQIRIWKTVPVQTTAIASADINQGHYLGTNAAGLYIFVGILVAFCTGLFWGTRV